MKNAYFKVRKETPYRSHVRVFRPWRCEIELTSIPLGFWPQLDVSFQTLYFCGMEKNCHMGRKMVKKFITIFNETEVLESIWWQRNITPLNWVVVPFRLIFDSNSSFLTQWRITSQKILIRSYNGSPSKNPDIKTPLVVSFSLGVVIHFSPLAAFWC